MHSFWIQCVSFEDILGTIVIIIELTILQISQSLYLAIVILITGSNWKWKGYATMQVGLCNLIDSSSLSSSYLVIHELMGSHPL